MPVIWGSAAVCRSSDDASEHIRKDCVMMTEPWTLSCLIIII